MLGSVFVHGFCQTLRTVAARVRGRLAQLERPAKAKGKRPARKTTARARKARQTLPALAA